VRGPRRALFVVDDGMDRSREDQDGALRGSFGGPKIRLRLLAIKSAGFTRNSNRPCGKGREALNNYTIVVFRFSFLAALTHE
jgi:hypothetical protein